jgi:hypothetical protein
VRLQTGKAPPSGRYMPEFGEISTLKGLLFHLPEKAHLRPFLRLSFGHDP